MTIPLYQIDAFTDAIFAGNPAAVCPLEAWLSDDVMQAIAAENNLSETAFLVATPDGPSDFDLRWFTPATEVPLCGHATMASAHVLFEHLQWPRPSVAFHTLSGRLDVHRDAGGLAMNLPAWTPEPVDLPPALAGVFDRSPRDFLQYRPGVGMCLAVFDDPVWLRDWVPDLAAIANLQGDGLIISAPGSTPEIDFVSRYFAPGAGIPEDPVTGSAHCVLAPYWAEQLSKRDLAARQVSKRGGRVACRFDGERVVVSGRAATYLIGALRVS